jgi:hypothetical protein
MSEMLYEDNKIRITARTLEQGSTSYPVNKIVSVAPPLKEPFEFFGGFLLNGVLFLFGLWCISHFTTGWLIGGGIASLIGGFNVWGQFNRYWWVRVEITGTDDLRIRRNKKEEIDAIYFALRQVIDG